MGFTPTGLIGVILFGSFHWSTNFRAIKRIALSISEKCEKSLSYPNGWVRRELLMKSLGAYR